MNKETALQGHCESGRNCGEVLSVHCRTAGTLGLEISARSPVYHVQAETPHWIYAVRSSMDKFELRRVVNLAG